MSSGMVFQMLGPTIDIEFWVKVSLAYPGRSSLLFRVEYSWDLINCEGDSRSYIYSPTFNLYIYHEL